MNAGRRAAIPTIVAAVTGRVLRVAMPEGVPVRQVLAVTAGAAVPALAGAGRRAASGVWSVRLSRTASDDGAEQPADGGGEGHGQRAP